MLVVLYHGSRMIALPQYVGHIPLGYFFSFGHAGVDFFFVLSGFIITYVHRADIGNPRRLNQYLWKRVTRIYPLYWFVTAIVLIFASFSAEKLARLDAWHVIASLALIPHAREPLLGVAWTLQYEMLFYLTFAIAILHARAGILLLAVGVLAVLVAQIYPATGQLGSFLTSRYHCNSSWVLRRR
jgi:exopolysaccharide production protein ExoZ